MDSTGYTKAEQRSCGRNMSKVWLVAGLCWQTFMVACMYRYFSLHGTLFAMAPLTVAGNNVATANGSIGATQWVGKQFFWSDPVLTATKRSSSSRLLDAVVDVPPLPPTNLRKEEKVLVTTFLFGEKAANQRRLRMWALSAETSGLNYAIIGDTRPPFDLPPNIIFVNVTFEGFVERLIDKVFDNTLNSTLHAHYARKLVRKEYFYKVCEWKPLVGHLFPEVVDGYDWWGHVDNDMIMGNVTKWLSQSLLRNSDIISPDNGKPGPHVGQNGEFVTLGYFTLYRNSPVVNTLYRYAQRNLGDLFLKPEYFYFDEFAQHNPQDINSTMSGIIRLKAKELGLRVSRNFGPHFNDFEEAGRHYKLNRGPQHQFDKVPEEVAGCRFEEDELKREKNGEEVMFCHYIDAKKTEMFDASLKDDSKFEDLIKTRTFRCTFVEGYDYVRKPLVRNKIIK